MAASQVSLAIDTCTAVGSICLSESGSILHEKTWNVPGSHSEVITVELLTLLKDSDLSIKDLDQVIVANGPGSFTGIRIGLNFAKSLAYSLKLPIFEYSTLEGFAEYGSDLENPVVSVIQGFRDLYYCGIYELRAAEGWVEKLNPSAVTAAEIRRLLDQLDYRLVGSGGPGLILELPELDQSLIKGSTQPSAANLVSAHFRKADHGLNTKDWKQSSPLYVRASEAEEKLKKQLDS